MILRKPKLLEFLQSKIFNWRYRGPQQLDVGKVKVPRPANIHEEYGEKCLVCSGFGYTVRFPDGKVLFCKPCNKTGVKGVL